MNITILNAQTEKSILQHYTGQVQLFLYDLTCDYPFFGEWLKKVLYEIKKGVRQIVILTENDNPRCIIGLTILKNDQYEKKICTIRVSKGFQRRGYGTELVRKSLEILGTDFPLATVSEKHIEAFKPFFWQFGFRVVGKVKSLYHIGEYEYFFNIPYSHKHVLISIKPQYANKILNREKTVEFRRSCFPDTVRRAFIYASTPIKKIIGYFEVNSLDIDTPKAIWNKYQKEGYISKEEYDRYSKGASSMTAIIINSAQVYDEQISLVDIMSGSIRAPQNFCYIDNVSILKIFARIENSSKSME